MVEQQSCTCPPVLCRQWSRPSATTPLMLIPLALLLPYHARAQQEGVSSSAARTPLIQGYELSTMQLVMGIFGIGAAFSLLTYLLSMLKRAQDDDLLEIELTDAHGSPQADTDTSYEAFPEEEEGEINDEYGGHERSLLGDEDHNNEVALDDLEEAGSPRSPASLLS